MLHVTHTQSSRCLHQAEKEMGVARLWVRREFRLALCRQSRPEWPKVRSISSFVCGNDCYCQFAITQLLGCCMSRVPGLLQLDALCACPLHWVVCDTWSSIHSRKAKCKDSRDLRLSCIPYSTTDSVHGRNCTWARRFELHLHVA